jgi:hypothetical protein
MFYKKPKPTVSAHSDQVWSQKQYATKESKAPLLNQTDKKFIMDMQLTASSLRDTDYKVVRGTKGEERQRSHEQCEG